MIETQGAEGSAVRAARVKAAEPSPGHDDTVHRVIETPVGPLTLVARAGGLTAVYYDQHKRLPDRATFGPVSTEGIGVVSFDEVERQLGEYFAGERRSFSVPLAPRGNDFARRVWGLLAAIPYGETRSYGAVATELGDIGLARAVGTATGANPISIIVPCHRLVGSTGALTGYAGGLDRKRLLLALEGSSAVDPSRLF
ncbi:methylated-DNA--[protein]-cysteine S-methyltransferase [Frigoribacterium sp. 2-23]|uniref:methylated-DNA--[protein]-cysteine S-methyltransferase n=1 Tax=Frigoribacterium sp. 2-23 TaxID=3415006 RepID=UPI003C6F7ECE